MGITINPNIQTSAQGSFNLETTGVIVGTAYPDPASRYYLSGGTLEMTETLPMWGGVGISEFVPVTSTVAQPMPGKPLGSLIKRATAAANLTGFAVFDQNYAAVNTPQSPAPQTAQGGLVNFYRWGSNARLALEIDPTLVTAEGGLITQALGWDFTNQKIIAGTGFTGRILVIHVGNSMAPVYDATHGFLSWNRVATAAIVLL